MKRKSRFVAFTAALVLTATMAKAQTTPLFSAHELTLDLAGSYVAEEQGVPWR